MNTLQDTSCAVAVASALGVSSEPDAMAPVRAAAKAADDNRAIASMYSQLAADNRAQAEYFYAIGLKAAGDQATICAANWENAAAEFAGSGHETIAA